MTRHTGILPVVALLLGLVLTSVVAAEVVQPDQRWAYAPNAGWLDARPHGDGGPGLHVSAGVVTGWLFSTNIGWISAHCLNTDSCKDVAYGLQLEEIFDQPDQLRLAGHLWSANAGWIVAHCKTIQFCGQTEFGLQIDRKTGLINGFAWSENLGWISFSCTGTSSCSDNAYGVGLLPEFVVPVLTPIFSDRFEHQD